MASLIRVRTAETECLWAYSRQASSLLFWIRALRRRGWGFWAGCEGCAAASFRSCLFPPQYSKGNGPYDVDDQS